jgi:integrase
MAVDECEAVDVCRSLGLSHLARAASLAIGSGVNPKVVQRMLGHASAAMTLDVYADLSTLTSRRLPTSYLNCGQNVGTSGDGAI